MRRVVPLLTVLLLAACSSPQMYWWNNNSGANWGTDLYECTRDHSTTITSGGGTGLAGAISAGEVGSSRTDYGMRDLCLQSRSWYKAAAGAGPTPARTPPPPPAPAVVLPSPSIAVAPVPTQDAWIFVARKSFLRSYTGSWGRDARADCEARRTEDLRTEALQAPTDARWEYGRCRSISVSFERGPGAQFGPPWAVVGTKTFSAGPTERACTQQRARLTAASPTTTLESCRQVWFSSEPDKL
jgi:hypothetical protein